MASFEASAAEVASTLKLAIQNERDLVINAAGFVISDPGVTERQFLAWAGSVRALQRYPELTWRREWKPPIRWSA